MELSPTVILFTHGLRCLTQRFPTRILFGCSTRTSTQHFTGIICTSYSRVNKTKQKRLSLCVSLSLSDFFDTVMSMENPDILSKIVILDRGFSEWNVSHTYIQTIFQHFTGIVCDSCCCQMQYSNGVGPLKMDSHRPLSAIIWMICQVHIFILNDWSSAYTLSTSRRVGFPFQRGKVDKLVVTVLLTVDTHPFLQIQNFIPGEVLRNNNILFQGMLV